MGIWFWSSATGCSLFISVSRGLAFLSLRFSRTSDRKFFYSFRGLYLIILGSEGA